MGGALFTHNATNTVPSLMQLVASILRLARQLVLHGDHEIFLGLGFLQITPGGGLRRPQAGNFYSRHLPGAAGAAKFL